MRPIGQLESEEHARTFADYLFVHGVAAEMEPGKGGGHSIWVVDEDRVEEAKALLSRFRSMPDAEEFYQATQAARERRRGEQKEEREEQRKLKRAETAAWRLGRGGATMAMMVACVAAGLLTQFGKNDELMRWLLISNYQPADPAQFWLSLREVASGEVWRLVTPVFLHFSVWHLLFNVLWLNDFGNALESRTGTWRFLGVAAAIALTSNLAQYATGGAGFGGMSGVVYGLFGYLWARNRVDDRFGVYVSPMASGLLMVYLAMGFFNLLGPTANAAHVSGLAAGAILGLAAGMRKG